MNKWLDSTVAAYLRYFGSSTAPVVYDVGSRDGNDGYELAERIFDGTKDQVEDAASIVLFEPNPPQAELIRHTYPSATVIEKAASDNAGTADFLAIDGGDDIAATGSSSMDLNRRDHKPGDKKVIQVETVRLETIIAQRAEPHIDIMKIDAEGFTYEILQGLDYSLGGVKVLHLETEMIGHLVTNKNNREVFEFMRNAGFLCYALEYEWGGIEDQVWVNAELISHA